MQAKPVLLTAALLTASIPLAAQIVTVDRPLVQTGQPQAQPAGPRGAIWGTVVSGTSGQPVDRVRLRLSGGSPEGGMRTRTIYSDDDGRFAFLDLPAGAYTLNGSKTGYVSINFGQRNPGAGRPGTPIELQPGQQIKDLTFSLPPGGVITGVIFDEKNRPSVATPVRVMRWSMANGERSLTSAGTSTTDDRGIYRVYGLPPGDYLVSAMPRNTGVEQSAEMGFVLEERMAELQAQGLAVSGSFSISTTGIPDVAGDQTDNDEATIGYAPVFYPGTMDVGAATAVTLGVSQELTNVDVALQQVALSRVEGAVIVPPDVNARTIQVRLYNVLAQVPGVSTMSTRVRDGEFTFTGVPPGQYRVMATADVRGEPDRRTQTVDGRTVVISSTNNTDRLWAAADVSVSGQHQRGITLILQPGLTVSGSIAFDGSGPRPTGRMRVTLTPFGPEASAASAGSRNANVDEQGRFTITGVVPATYRLRTSGTGAWSIRSAQYGGLDVMDYPLDLTSAQDADGIYVTLTDARTEVSGMIRTASGQPAPDVTVVVFPLQEGYWLPQARRIQSTRPSTGGMFSFSNLPPGDYRVAAVTDVEPGIWYDPTFLRALAAASVQFSLQPGQSVRQDLQVGG